MRRAAPEDDFLNRLSTRQVCCADRTGTGTGAGTVGAQLYSNKVRGYKRTAAIGNVHTTRGHGSAVPPIIAHTSRAGARAAQCDERWALALLETHVESWRARVLLFE